jgi:hypothetical protein
MGARSSRNTTQNNRSDGHLLEYFRNTFVRGGGASNVAAPSGLTATGGVISDYSDPGTGNIYRAHIFTSSGTFNVTGPGSYDPAGVEYLVVSGGGAGGNHIGGGGGAGGLLSNHPNIPAPLRQSAFPIPAVFPAPYSVTIGAGGAGRYGPSPTPGLGGNPSAFGPVSTVGGGGGGSAGGAGPSPAGSGGGMGHGPGTGTAGTPGQGNPGGSGICAIK